MKKNKTHRTFAGLTDMIVFMCAASMMVIICAIVIGGITAEPEQTKQVETETEAEPLVINTVESGDDILLTVIRDNGDTVFQYEGDLELWKCADGKAYGIIYLDEEVLQ